MAALRAKMFEVLAANRPCTDRQLFYLLESAGVIPKLETQYKGTVVRLLSQMRLAGEIPFSWIVDNTRWMRKPQTFSGLAQALAVTRQSYRRALWDDQTCYLELWCEKDAISGLIYQETKEYDVPLMVARGHSSLTFLHSCAEDITFHDKPAFVYYFGGFDPSGKNISENVEKRLREFAPGMDITFERVAVTPEQIKRWNLATRPTKASDSRSKNFRGASTDIEAIPPDKLRALVRDCIERHIDRQALEVTHAAEESEKRVLDMIPSLLRRSRTVRKELYATPES